MIRATKLRTESSDAAATNVGFRTERARAITKPTISLSAAVIALLALGRDHDAISDTADSGRFHFDGQGMIGTTLIAFSGEPFTILELMAT